VLHAVEAAIRDALRQARLPSQGALALLCAVPDTHLSLAEVVRMAVETGLAATPVDLARHPETLADDRGAVACDVTA
jgi:hypothetical protein